MDNYQFLFDIAVILLSTKILGLLTRRIHMPQVVGALAAGLIMGPACLGILTENDFIKLTAEVGVIVLMFCAGMQTDIDELKKSGKALFCYRSHRCNRTASRRFSIGMVLQSS